MASYQIPRLSAGGGAWSTTVATVADFISPGSYSLIACADAPNLLTEASDANNCLTSPVPLSIVDPVLLATTGIVPSVGATTGGTAVTITGQGFAAGATVTIGGVAATDVVVVDGETITAAAGAHAAGSVNATVTIPGPTSATLTDGFKYVALFTDDPLLRSVTPVRTFHIDELRTRINDVLGRLGQPACSLTDSPLSAGTIVRARAGARHGVLRRTGRGAAGAEDGGFGRIG